MANQIEVTCPCCSTHLTVDVLTRRVLRAAQPTEIDETGRVKLDEGRWDQANSRVLDRSATGADKLEDALARERDKESRLDDLFRKAQEKISGDEPEGDES